MNQRFYRMILMAGGAALAACGNNTIHEDYGAVEVTASAPTITKEFTTTDGWVVKYDRFLVSMTAISISASDTQVVTTSATPQIFDAVAPEPTTLLSDVVRRAQPWDSFTFQIAPAVESEDATITLAEAVKESDRDLMTKGGFSVYLEAKATKEGVTKTMKWGFTTDTSFSECEGERGGVKVKGIIIPPDGTESVDLAFRGDVLFSDDLSAPGVGLRFETIAAADADMNGEITLDELTATTLDVARAFGPYGTAEEKDITDLGAFTGVLTRNIVASFREKGSCVAAPTPAATP
jgi:hypothetical protein